MGKSRKNLSNRNETLSSQTVENAGFIKEGTTIKTYIQSRKALGYSYAKREVLGDGVSTITLKNTTTAAVTTATNQAVTVRVCRKEGII